MNANFATIPAELQSIPQWVCWRPEDNGNSDTTKVPYVAGKDHRASTTDPTTWSDFGSAVAGVHGHGGGIGFVFNGDGYVGIDLDEVRDPKTEVTQPWAAAIIQHLDTYSEVSVSGTGVHCIARGTLPAGRRKSGPLEAYDAKRFFCCTGDRLPTARATIETRDLAFLHALLSTGLFADPDFLQLANNDNTRFPSASEADLSFCSRLARAGFSAREIDLAMGVFRFREKWERDDYCESTIRTALQNGSSKPALTISGESRFVGQLITNKDGAPLRILANAITAVRSQFANALAFNEFSHRTVALKALPWKAQPGDWTDVDDLRCCEWLHHQEIFVSSKVASEAIEVVASEHRIHPIREYLQALTWDGTVRLDLWLVAYFEAPETEFVKAVGPRWLTSAVARVFQPGCQVDHTLLLQGAQGIGKSSGLRALVGDEWFTSTLSTLGSKDAREELRGKWVAEISELNAMRRAETEAVKSFLTERCDHFRVSYGRRAQDFPRQTIFAASTNSDCFLLDETGSRRFWPVHCGTVDFKAIERNRDQVWGEAYFRYRRGDCWWMETSALNKLAEVEQEFRYQKGPRDERIEEWVEAPQPREAGYHRDADFPWNGSMAGKVNVQDVCVHALEIPISQVKQSDQKEVARCLRHLGWAIKQESAGPHRGKRFYISPEPPGYMEKL